MALIAAAWALYALFKNRFWQKFGIRFLNAIRDHYEIFAMFVFLAIYWAASLIGSLNIGLRHILPAFAFTYLLVVIGLKICSPPLPKKNPKNRKNYPRYPAGLVYIFILGHFPALSGVL